MKQKIALTGDFAWAGVNLLELLISFAKARSAADFMYALTHIFGIGLPLPAALALRALLIASSGAALADGIKRISPKLYEKVYGHDKEQILTRLPR